MLLTLSTMADWWYSFYQILIIKKANFNILINKNKNIIDLQFTFISIFISSFIHLILIIILSKDLSVSDLGLYTLLFTIYILLGPISNLGLGIALTTYVSKDINDDNILNKYISSGIIGSILYGIILSILLILFSGFISDNIFHAHQMGELLIIVAFCIPFFSFQKVVLGILNGFRLMNNYAFINILQNILMIILSAIFVIIFKMGVYGAVLGFVIPTIIVGIISYIFIKNLFKISLNTFFSVLKNISIFGFYVSLGTVLSMFNSQINTMLVGYYLNLTDVGYFVVSITIVQGILLIPSSVQIIIGPIISSYFKNNDYINIKKVIKNTMIKILLVTVIISSITIIFGTYIIKIFFSSDYLPAYLPLIILVIGYTIYAPIMSIGTLFANIGRVSVSFKINTINIIINILLNISLIPIFGIMGAALATSIAVVFAALLNLYIIYVLLK